MRTNCIIFICLFLTLTSFSLVAHARTVTIDGPDPLDIIIFSGNYPPFNIQDDGIIDGIGPSIVHEVLKRMNQPYTLRALPWNRAMESMREGEADAVLALFKTADRQVFLVYPDEPLFMESNHFFTLKTTNIPYGGDLSRLKNYPISIVKGYSYGPAVDAATSLDLRPSVGDEKMARMVFGGRYPLGIGNRHVVSYFADKHGVGQQIKFLEPPVTNSPSFIAFSKRRHLQDIATTFSKTLKRFKKTAQYQALLASYGIKP